jgi:hypothetical protein
MHIYGLSLLYIPMNKGVIINGEEEFFRWFKIKSESRWG